jgi:hypothetical protein
LEAAGAEEAADLRRVAARGEPDTADIEDLGSVAGELLAVADELDARGDHELAAEVREEAADLEQTVESLAAEEPESALAQRDLAARTPISSIPTGRTR